MFMYWVGLKGYSIWSCRIRYYRDSSPKKCMSSFTHPPQEVPNLYEFLCSAEHKIQYFEESVGAPLTSIVGKKYYGSQWCPRTALYPSFFRISAFVFSRTKTFIQVWNYLRVSKLHNYHCWVNYTFNMCFISTNKQPIC